MPTLNLSGLLAILVAGAVLALSFAQAPEPDPSWSSLPTIDFTAAHLAGGGA